MSSANPLNNTDIHLPYLAVISITGLDAEKLLQGQSSCDVSQLDTSHSTLGTLSTAKGKMYANFLLLKNKENGFLMVLHKGLADNVLKQLKKYAVFYKCNILSADDLFVNANSHHQGEKLSVNDSNNTINIHWLNQRNLVLSSTAGHSESATNSDWQQSEYQAGWFWLNEKACEAYTAPMLNMDKLNAISFDKGCYTGQEVIARTHYKGTLKKRLQLLCCNDLVSTEFKQTIIDAHTKNVGHVINSIQSGTRTYIFALLKLDTNEVFLEQSNDNKKLQIENLPYTVE
jgi:tRNA-modifying protein YgfZ